MEHVAHIALYIIISSVCCYVFDSYNGKIQVVINYWYCFCWSNINMYEYYWAFISLFNENKF